MIIAQDSVVSFTFELADADGKPIEQSGETMHYLHGGYGNMFPRVEEALEGRQAGETVRVALEPGDAFGEYDSELVRVEPLSALPGDVEVGMHFEGSDPAGGEPMLFTVTGVAEGKAVLDGNHPLAGMRLVFTCAVQAVRPATAEETAHGHPHADGAACH